MSKFPSFQERPIPSAGGFNPIQAQAPDLSAPNRAIAELGETIQRSSAEVGGAIEDMQKRQERFDYRIARSKFLQNAVNLENQIDLEPDYRKTPELYRQKIAEIKQSTIDSLPENRFSPLLREEMNLYEAKQFGDIARSASQKLSFEQRAQADQITEENLNAFVRTADPVAQEALIKSSIETFADSIPDNDPKKPILVQEESKRIGKRFAETSLVSKSPIEQIALINQENKKPGSTIAAFLPADERQEWLLKAETLKEKQDQAAIKAAERREKQNAIKKDTIMIDGLQQGLSFDQLPLEVKMKASKEDIERYENIRLQQLGGEQNSDVKELNFQKYQDLYAQRPEEFANMSLAKIASEVPFNKVDEIKKWHNEAFNGQRAPVGISEKVEIGNKFVSYMGIKPSDNKAVRFKKAFEEQINYFKQQQGREPGRKELENIGNDLITQQTFTEKGWFGNSTKTARGFEIDKSKQVIEPTTQEIDDIQTKARKSGKRIPTEDEIRRVYPEILKRKSQMVNDQLSYAFPEDAKSPEDIRKALEDESRKNPGIFNGRDLEKESEGIYNRFYKGRNA